MATRFLEQGLDLEKSPYGDKAPFGVDHQGLLGVTRGARFKGLLAADPGKEPVDVGRIVVITDTNATASVADHGVLAVAGTTNSVTLNLPKASSQRGLRIGLGVGALTASGGHKIKPDPADTIVFAGTSAGSSVRCDAASDALGDVLWVQSDGTSNWYVVARVGTWSAST